jgi:hypothetical protein
MVLGLLRLGSFAVVRATPLTVPALFGKKEATMNIHPFYLEQYKMLRDEIMFTIGQIYSTEIYTVIAAAGIYAWLFVNASRISVRAVWFVPTCLIFVSAIHCLILALRLSLLGDYLRGIEETVFEQNNNVLGWERYKLLHGQWIEKTDYILSSLGWLIGFGASIALSWRQQKVRGPETVGANVM